MCQAGLTQDHLVREGEEARVEAAPQSEDSKLFPYTITALYFVYFFCVLEDMVIFGDVESGQHDFSDEILPELSNFSQLSEAQLRT